MIEKKKRKDNSGLIGFKPIKKKVNNKKNKHPFKLQLKGLVYNAVKSTNYVSIALVVAIIGYNLLFGIGAKDAISSLAETISNVFEIKLEQFEDFSNKTLSGGNTISQFLLKSLNTNEENTLRKILLIDKDNNVIYCFKNDILKEVTINDIKIINEDNKVYEYFKSYANGSESKLSDWLYNNLDNTYTRIIPSVYTNANGEKIILGLGYSPTSYGKSFSSFIGMFDDLKIELSSKDGSVLCNKKETMMFGETKTVATSLLNRTDENGNKISMIESIQRSIYILLDSIDFITKEDSLSSKSEKTDIKVRFDVADVVNLYQLNIVYWALVLFAIYLTGVYLFANNAEQNVINKRIISYVSVITILIVTFNIVLMYTNNFEIMRSKQLVGDSLLFEINSVSPYNLEQLELYVLDEMQNDINDENYNEFCSIAEQVVVDAYKDIHYNSLDVQCGIHSMNCPNNNYRYETLKKEMIQCDGQKTNIDENKEHLHIINYFEKMNNDMKMIYKIDIGISKSIYQLDKSNNTRIPSVFIKNKGKLYELGDTVTDSNHVIDYDYETFDEHISYTLQNGEAIIRLKESNFGYYTYFIYKVDTTVKETIFILIISLIEIFFIGVLILRSIITKEEKIEENQNDRYGEIIYYTPEELNKEIAMKEELKKLNEDEVEEEQIYHSKRRKLIEDVVEDNLDDDKVSDFKDSQERNEMKNLGVFKTSKEIYERFTNDQIETSAKLNPNKIRKASSRLDDKEEKKGIDVQTESLTLAQANEKYRKTKVTKEDIANQNALKKNTIENDEFLNTSKDEDFEKTLNDKFKDAKK